MLSSFAYTFFPSLNAAPPGRSNIENTPTLNEWLLQTLTFCANANSESPPHWRLGAAFLEMGALGGVQLLQSLYGPKEIVQDKQDGVFKAHMVLQHQALAVALATVRFGMRAGIRAISRVPSDRGPELSASRSKARWLMLVLYYILRVLRIVTAAMIRVALATALRIAIYACIAQLSRVPALRSSSWFKHYQRETEEWLNTFAMKYLVRPSLTMCKNIIRYGSIASLKATAFCLTALWKASTICYSAEPPNRSEGVSSTMIHSVECSSVSVTKPTSANVGTHVLWSVASIGLEMTRLCASKIFGDAHGPAAQAPNIDKETVMQRAEQVPHKLSPAFSASVMAIRYSVMGIATIRTIAVIGIETFSICASKSKWNLRTSPSPVLAAEI